MPRGYGSADDGASSDGNCIVGNTIRDHDQTIEGIGIRLYDSGNTIYRNNLVDNLSSASDDGQNNLWDHDGQGNYWSDYEGQDEDHDGIGDMPFIVAPNGVDNHPLMTPYVRRQVVYLPLVLGSSPQPEGSVHRLRPSSFCSQSSKTESSSLGY